MFENSREIMILHGSFLSARSNLISQKKVELVDFIGLNDDDINLAVYVIQDTVDFIYSGYGGTVSGWSSAHQEHALQKIHAVLFYKALKSCGISCPEADKFYESVPQDFLAFDWRFYLKVISSSHLIQYLPQCLLQLPGDIVEMLLWWTLKETWSDSHTVPSILYALLSVLLQNSLKLHPTCEELSRFDFSFKILPEQVHVEVEPISEKVISFMKNGCQEVDLCGLFFSWMSSLLDILLASKAQFCQIKSDFITEILVHIRDYLSSRKDLHKIIISSSLDHAQYFNSKEGFVNYPAYNVFLMYHQWQELHQLLVVEDSNSDVAKIISDIVELSYYFHPFKSSDSTGLDHCISMLTYVVNAKINGLPYAIKMLLKEQEYIQKDESLRCLQNNLQPIISDISYVQLLLDAAVMNAGPNKTKIVDLFITVFKKLPTADQHLLLSYRFDKYGVSLDFKSSFYEPDIIKFLLSVDAEKLMEIVASLCIQALEETVQRMMCHSIQHKFSPNAVKALHSIIFSVTCSKEKFSPPLLIKCLKHAIKDDLTEEEKAQSFFLMQELIKTFTNVDVFPYHQFFTTFILPHLHAQCSPQDLQFSLQLLSVLLQNSQEEISGTWLENVNISVLIVLLSLLLSFSITSMNMTLKESLVLLLSELLKLQEKNTFLKQYYDTAIDRKWVRQCVLRMHPAVKFYVLDFMQGSDIDSQYLDLQSLLWWYAACNKNSTIVQNKIWQCQQHFGHLPLVRYVAQMIPCLTTDEFLQLMVLFEKVIPLASVTSAALECENYNMKIPESELTAVYLMEVMVDALILLNSCQNIFFDWPHIITTFSNAVKVCVKDIASSPVLLTKVFLEVCRLYNTLECEFDALNVALHTIKTAVKVCKTDSGILKICNAYMMTAQQKLGGNIYVEKGL